MAYSQNSTTNIPHPPSPARSAAPPAQPPALPTAPAQAVITSVTLKYDIADDAGDTGYSVAVALPLEAADDPALNAALDAMQAAIRRITARIGPRTPEPISAATRAAPPLSNHYAHPQRQIPAAPAVPMDMPFDRRDPFTNLVYRRGTPLSEVPSHVLREIYEALHSEQRKTAIAIEMQSRGERI